jgi:hypothetical protein
MCESEDGQQAGSSFFWDINVPGMGAFNLTVASIQIALVDLRERL